MRSTCRGGKDIGLRDRNSDFFIFSKKFIGGERTGYCRSGTMEQVFPQVNLASAMAISAAAASPNMGRSTSPALVAFMTLINVRLGVWVPNPGLLEEDLARRTAKHAEAKRGRTRRRIKRAAAPAGADAANDGHRRAPWLRLRRRLPREEMASLQKRWRQLGDRAAGRGLDEATRRPTVAHNLAGIAFSGGGIRSATTNLGMTSRRCISGRTVLSLRLHVDGVRAAAISAWKGIGQRIHMRYGTLPVSEVAGLVALEVDSDGHKIVSVKGGKGELAANALPLLPDADLLVRNGDKVRPGRRLVEARSGFQCCAARSPAPSRSRPEAAGASW